METFNRRARFLLALALVVLIGFVAAPLAQQAAAPASAQVQAPAKDAVPGVRNFTKVDATIACGGALSAEAYPALKQAGFRSIVNLRAASEEGVNIEEAQKRANDAGLTYFHVPFVNTAPETAKVDEFLKIVADPSNQPVMLHCASGARASMFWAAKRVMLDGWPVDKAMHELPELSGHVSEPVKTFFLDYFKSHGKTRP
jgi:uncharacterized protein (TIGR01244 family)